MAHEKADETGAWAKYWCNHYVRDYPRRMQRRADAAVLDIVDGRDRYRGRRHRVDSRTFHRLAVQEAMKRGLIKEDPGPL